MSTHQPELSPPPGFDIDESAEALLDAVTEQTEANAMTLDDAATRATSAIVRAEIDAQVATANAYPRSLKTFRSELRAWATSVPSIAEECTYQLPRGGSKILGPSIRFAELVLAAWGNCNVDTVILDAGDDPRSVAVTVMATARDLQRNTATRAQVRRSILKSSGGKQQQHMIETHIAAASAIARRNAILQLVPRALWLETWEQSKQVMFGNAESHADRLAKVLAQAKELGFPPEAPEGWLGRESADWSNDDLVRVAMRLKAVMDKECTPGEAFPEQETQPEERATTADANTTSAQQKLDAAAKEKDHGEEKDDGEEPCQLCGIIKRDHTGDDMDHQWMDKDPRGTSAKKAAAKRGRG